MDGRPPVAMDHSKFTVIYACQTREKIPHSQPGPLRGSSSPQWRKQCLIFRGRTPTRSFGRKLHWKHRAIRPFIGSRSIRSLWSITLTFQTVDTLMAALRNWLLLRISCSQYMYSHFHPHWKTTLSTACISLTLDLLTFCALVTAILFVDRSGCCVPWRWWATPPSV